MKPIANRSTGPVVRTPIAVATSAAATAAHRATLAALAAVKAAAVRAVTGDRMGVAAAEIDVALQKVVICEQHWYTSCELGDFAIGNWS